jgi:nitroreductase
MDMIPEIEKRRAYRALSTKPVSEEIIDRILGAAVQAASCANKQPWRFVVANKSPVLDQVKEHLSSGNYWAKPSPFIVGVCTRDEFDAQLSEGRNYAFFDTGMAVGNMLLQGVREGLYTHPIAGFSPAPIKEILEIPEDITLLTLVIFGYPGEVSELNEKHRESERSERSRKPMDETVAYGKWPGSWGN